MIKYINIFTQRLNSEVTMADIVNHMLMTHRFTMMEGLEYINVRQTIEKYFLKLDELLLENPELSEKYVMKIHYKHCDLILAFLIEVKNKIRSITTRTEYAQLFREMINDHNIYCYDKNHIRRWLDNKEIENALFSCRKRIMRPEIIKAKRAGKIVYFDETGDINFMEVV